MSNQKGFTLVEIAIVLVIVGLLLGGVLKGQALITGAKVTSSISQIKALETAVYGFQDRYRIFVYRVRIPVLAELPFRFPDALAV